MRNWFSTINLANRDGFTAGSALAWGVWICIVLCVLILAAIILSRVFWPAQIASDDALWIHLLALGIMPMLLLPFLSFTAFEASNQEHLCGSCHTMAPYARELHDPKSKRLAALHYRIGFARGEECYTCHIDYGVRATVAAKIIGVRDTWSEFAGTYPEPIKMRAPFANELCLKCHQGTTYFMREDSHIDGRGKITREILTDSILCTDCHGPAHDIGDRDLTKRGG
jgi:nitrate/TMAO reductase-like tetraheme cytochrome c subunit